LVVLAILASVFWPFTFPFVFAELLLLFYPLFARIEKRFEPLIFFWFGFVALLSLIFIVTVWNEPLFLLLSSSWVMPWGVFTGIFLHGSREHLVSNILDLCFFFYLYMTLAHTFPPQTSYHKNPFHSYRSLYRCSFGQPPFSIAGRHICRCFRIRFLR